MSSIMLLALSAVGWADAGMKPVTVAVVDRDTGKPVTAFSYQFQFETASADGYSLVPGWTPVESADGTIVVQAPTSCQLVVAVTGRDHLGAGEGVVLRPSDPARRIVLRLKRGITVRGVVRDSATKAPIAGARVAPAGGGERMPGDFDRAVTTDAAGRYELRGVDPKGGLAVSHPEYPWVSPWDQLVKGKAEHDVTITRLKRIRGVVRDRDGRPLPDVKISLDFGDAERAHTAADGTFDLADPEYDHGLKFWDQAHIARQVKREEFLRDGLVVVMEPKFVVEGQVSTPDGRSVPSFRVAVGPTPKGPWYAHEERTINDPAGRFTIRLDQPGPSYVEVRADGHAIWDGRVEVARNGKPLAIRLEPGTTISGQVLAPSRGGTPIRAVLTPRYEARDSRDGTIDKYGEMIETLLADVAPDGTVRFDHIRPSRYKLRLDGPKVTGTELAIDVPAQGCDLGAIRLAGRGRIVGRVHRPMMLGGGPWTFANGDVRGTHFDWANEIGFKSDEDGRFQVEDVPAGLVAACFYHSTPGCCVVDQYFQCAQVVEGKTTEVIAFDPAAARPLPIVLQVGDGSDAQFLAGSGRGGKPVAEVLAAFWEGRIDGDCNVFQAQLIPRSPGPLSFAETKWQGADPQKGLLLSDVGPGEYRLRLMDRLGEYEQTDAVLAERDITVPPREPIRIRLGAGCIKGVCPPNDEYRSQIIVVATPKGGKGPARQTLCDSEGNFCLRFLSPGRYTVRICDPKARWAKLDDIAVAVGATDLGAIKLNPGGTLAGTTSFRRPSPIPNVVVVTDETGTELRTRFDHLMSFDRFELSGLWPGRWTVSVRRDDAPIATGQVILKGTETARIDLTTPAGTGP